MTHRIHYTDTSIPDDNNSTLFQATGTALTSSYVLVGHQMPCGDSTTAFLHLYWTKGDETSIEIQARYALRRSGTEAVPTQISTAGDPNVLIDSTFQFTATGNHVIPFGTEGKYVSFYIKSTGGTPTGTYGAGVVYRRE